MLMRLVTKLAVDSSTTGLAQGVVSTLAVIVAVAIQLEAGWEADKQREHEYTAVTQVSAPLVNRKDERDMHWTAINLTVGVSDRVSERTFL